MSANRVVPSTGSPIQASLVTGRVVQLRAATDVYDRPGLDSHGVRTIGTRSEITPIRVLTFSASYAAALAVAAALRETIGTFVTLEYELSGYTDANVYVHDVRPTHGDGGEDVYAALQGSGNTHAADVVLMCQKM